MTQPKSSYCLGNIFYSLLKYKIHEIYLKSDRTDFQNVKVDWMIFEWDINHITYKITTTHQNGISKASLGDSSEMARQGQHLIEMRGVKRITYLLCLQVGPGSSILDSLNQSHWNILNIVY